MKKLQTNNIPNNPSIEDIDKDIDKILNILEDLDTSNLSIDADIDKISKDINNQLEDISKKYEPPPKFIKVCKFNERSVEAFTNDFQESIAQATFNPDIFSDPNSNYDIIEHVLINSKEKCLPEKNVKYKKYNHKLAPWMTSEILHSLKFKDNMYKK